MTLPWAMTPFLLQRRMLDYAGNRQRPSACRSQEIRAEVLMPEPQSGHPGTGQAWHMLSHMAQPTLLWGHRAGLKSLLFSIRDRDEVWLRTLPCWQQDIWTSWMATQTPRDGPRLSIWELSTLGGWKCFAHISPLLEVRIKWASGSQWGRFL